MPAEVDEVLEDEVVEEIEDISEEEEVVDETGMTEEEYRRARGDFVDDDEEIEEEEVQEEEVTEEVTEEVNEEVEEEEEPAEEETEDEEESPTEDIKIPKSRLDKEIAAKKAEREENQLLQNYIKKLEAREEQFIELLKNQQKEQEAAEQPPEFDIEAKEEAAMDAILEGDSKEYKRIRKEINDYILNQAVTASEGASARATEAAKTEVHKLDEESRFNQAVDELTNKYPIFDGNNKSYNEEALGEVNRLYTKFVNAGDNKTEALVEAVNLVAPKYGITEDKPALGDIEEAKVKRRTKAVKKAAKTTQQQPPVSKGKKTQSRVDEFSYDNLVSMSEKDWEKLPSAIKKKLRGD